MRGRGRRRRGREEPAQRDEKRGHAEAEDIGNMTREGGFHSLAPSFILSNVCRTQQKVPPVTNAYAIHVSSKGFVSTQRIF